jgi:hypothetical protein
MTIEINAGETFVVSCPANERPILLSGDKLPDAKNTIAKVLKIDKEIVTLGPYKAGLLTLTIPCTSTKLSVDINVKELNPMVASKRFPSLNPKTVGLPMGFLILFFALVLGLVISFFYFKKKKKAILSTKSQAPIKDPRMELEKHLTYCESTVKTPEKVHFHDTYKLLRKFLEKENNLKTRSLTTSEFLGTFRALGLKQSSNQQLLSQLEHVLKTSDDVRFSGKAVTSQIWLDYLSKTRAIILAFPIKDLQSKTAQSAKKQ